MPFDQVGKKFVLDAGVRFSGSCLWDLMSSYYDTQGAKAWARRGEIPSYITSNAFIATQYADLIAAYVRDVTLETCSSQGEVDTTQPFYVIEVGSGHGKFTFLLLERLRGLWSGHDGPTWVRHVFRQPHRHLGCSHPRAPSRSCCGAGVSEPVQR